jgi:AbrB family looped-hinge helix DNA binding protein
MSPRVTVNRSNQITLPASVRQQLGIKPGDHLIVNVRGRHVVLLPEPKDYVSALRGLGREIWEGIDADEYIANERASWQA